jgi:uncharacterized membrane protein (GlpM family)
MKWQDVFPVLVSIAVIICVAVLERQSRILAALTATMPLSAPLALWIVSQSSHAEQGAIAQFSLGLVLGILPTVAFLLVVWLAARQGFRLGPMLLAGYATWGVAAVCLFVFRRALGV